MTKEERLRRNNRCVGGMCVGAGVGTCMGVAMHNVLVGLLLGPGSGLCFASAFGAFRKE